MPFGDGDLVGQVAGIASNGINNLSNVITSMNLYNETRFSNWIDGNLSYFIQEVRQYCRGEVSDLDDSNHQILSTLAEPASNYGSNCNSQLNSDSWVPSNNQDTAETTYIACSVSSGEVGDLTTCTAVLTNNGANVCAGCMDSTFLLTNYPTATDGAALTAALGERYSVTCAFNQ